MSGAMKSGVLRRSSSIVSRARCAGSLSCWKVNMFPKTCYIVCDVCSLCDKKINCTLRIATRKRSRVGNDNLKQLSGLAIKFN